MKLGSGVLAAVVKIVGIGAEDETLSESFLFQLVFRFVILNLLEVILP